MPSFRSHLLSASAILGVAFALFCPALALAQTTISGTVTNATTHKPSAGDAVVLVRLAQGMQTDAQTTTDAHGHYSITVADNGLHLVRVTHDKANYFRPAPPGTTSVDLDVYNAAAHVKGVSTEADVYEIQTDPSGSTLKVIENFWVKNESDPPMTQFSKDPFDFYLPDGAVVDGAAALGPGGMPVQAAPVPLPEKNHYTFLFPLRPGETRFQISYHLPYSGTINVQPHLTTRTANLVLMLPKSMQFTPAPGNAYQQVEEEPNAQTYVARDVSPATPAAFTLSGTGQLPRDAGSATADNGQNGQSADNGQAEASTEDTRPGSGLGTPLNPTGNRDPWSKYKWWILGGLVILLAAAAGVLLRKPPTAAVAPAPQPEPSTPEAQHDRMMAALKEELFALETEHLQGTIPEADYAAHKAAIETVMRRALRSEGNVVPASAAATKNPANRTL